jgi:hypothetical protein
MKILRVIGTTALFVFLGSTIPAFAQEEQHDQQAKPDQHEEQAKPAKQEEKTKPQQRQEEAKPAKQEEKDKPEQRQEQAKSEKPTAENKQAKYDEGNKSSGQHVQRTPAEQQRQRAVPELRLSVRSGSRIPDDRFHSNFGRGHEFRIGSPRMVGGYSRFQYGGYWFGFVQPWPAQWYYTDDVYVDFIDGGYYLCNPYYPDDRVSISVVL